jgi:hypothetical protein
MENEISKDIIGDNWADKSDAWVVLLKDGKFGEPAKLVYSTSINVGPGEVIVEDEEPGNTGNNSPQPLDEGEGEGELNATFPWS